MKIQRTLILTISLMAAVPCRPVQTEADLPVRISKLSNRVIVAWVGDYAQGNQMVAVASKKGIVLIDTYASRVQQQQLRKAIEHEFGRSDFIAVINTHQHYDHTNGNSLYTGLPIIAHQASREGMISDVARIPEWIARVKQAIQAMEENQKTLEAESQGSKTNRENITYWQTVIRDMESEHVPAYPNVTFSDRMSLDLEDVTLDLFSFPGLHTRGDILIHIPQENVLCVGDMIADGWLPPLNKDIVQNPIYMLQTWEEVIKRGSGIQHVLPGHSYVKVSFETFKWRYNYFKTLWEGLLKAKAAGKSLADVQTMFAFEAVFPGFGNIKRTLPSRTEGKPIDVHAQNLDVLWNALQK